MKQLTFVLLDDHDICENVLRILDDEGFNGTAIPSTSIKHMMHETPMFFSLSTIDNPDFKNHTCIFILAEKERAKEISTIVKKETNEFTKCKGAIISLPVEYYAGNF